MELIHAAADSTASTPTALVTLGIFAFGVISLLLYGRSRSVQKKVALEKGQRVRLMALEWMEPMLEILIVLGLLWADLSDNAGHLVAAAIGAVVGAFFGRWRAQILWVRAEPTLKAVVMKRSWAEYLAFALLIIVKVLSESFTAKSGWLSWVLTAAVALVVAEAVTRVIVMHVWYRRAIHEAIRA